MVMGLLDDPRDAEWIGCIDFGTAMSKVAVVKRKPREQLIPNDIRALAIGPPPTALLLPSIVYVTEQGLLFAQEAENAAIRGERLGRQAFVSAKQYLSTQEPQALDERLEPDRDPTGTYTPRMLIALFLGYLLVQSGRVAAAGGVPWPVPLRVARPAWRQNRAADGEETLKGLVLQAFAIVDKLGAKLFSETGVTHAAAQAALSKIMRDKRFEDPMAFRHVFELSAGSASVLEATAVAAGSIRDTGRRIIAVADVGAGTSDFGAFMTGIVGHDLLAEIPGSSRILHEAGDLLDMLLTRHILDAAGIDPFHPAGRGAASRLRARQRAHKEVLFAEGQVTVEVGDDIRTITQQEFMVDARVKDFAKRLRSKFDETLVVAVKCARQFTPPLGGKVPVEILLTGGGHALPMVRELATNPSQGHWTYLEASPEIEVNDEIDRFRWQLAVAIGGAVQDLPLEMRLPAPAPVLRPRKDSRRRKTDSS
jgi:molecular chaperone DnaK (HSP70)